MRITRTVETSRPPGEVFDYLSDFTTTTEWEPATVSTSRVSGDGTVGTRYVNVSKFLGSTSELEYEVVTYSPPDTIVLRGRNASLDARDTIELTAIENGGTRVSYTAEFHLRSWRRIAAPVLAPALRRLVDKGGEGLDSVLNGRSGPLSTSRSGH